MAKTKIVEVTIADIRTPMGADHLTAEIEFEGKPDKEGKPTKERATIYLATKDELGNYLDEATQKANLEAEAVKRIQDYRDRQNQAENLKGQVLNVQIEENVTISEVTVEAI